MRVAAIDCGTNSVRLLVADIDSSSLTDVDRRMEIVRLGENVDRTGEFSAPALERTLAVCRRYAEIIEKAGAGRVRFAATSATRDAANRQIFIAGVREILGVDPEVISGDQEAELSFVGATRELRQGGFDSPYLVVDIGGGSTEFVLGDEHAEAARSVDIGCVRLTERHLHDDPPSAAQVAAARADIRSGLRLAADVVPLSKAATLVGVAGTVTTVAAMVRNLPAYDAERIHLSRLSAADVHSAAARLLAASRAERARLPYMHPGRVDVIGAGALILSETVVRAGLPEVIASEHDILDGLAWSLGT
jgi:exopolyphosphatase/guanosine-5'-triphosphate,3'-diphosphate pyrophosphatase